MAEWAVPLPREAYGPVIVASMHVTVTFSRYMRRRRAMCDRDHRNKKSVGARTKRRPLDPQTVSVGEAHFARPRGPASVTDFAVIGGSTRIAEIAALAETADASTGPALEAVEAGGTTLTVRDGRAAERGALRGNAIARPVSAAIERPALRAHVVAALA